MNYAVDDTDEDHVATYRRHRLGLSMFNRPTYGWNVSCSCGWEQKSNENKRAVERDFKDHLRSAGRR